MPFQVLGVGDDDEVARMDTELGEGVGCGGNGRSKLLTRHMNIWLVCFHVDDGVLGFIFSSEGDGVEQCVKLGACLLCKQLCESLATSLCWLKLLSTSSKDCKCVCDGVGWKNILVVLGSYPA